MKASILPGGQGQERNPPFGAIEAEGFSRRGAIEIHVRSTGYMTDLVTCSSLCQPTGPFAGGGVRAETRSGSA
jgi:hypothetical protein